MAHDKEPKWEVVDEIPGEKRPRPAPCKNPLKSKPLWIGVGIGVLVVVLFPPLFATALLIVKRLAAAWWLWLAVAVYWYWRRMQRRQRRR